MVQTKHYTEEKDHFNLEYIQLKHGDNFVSSLNQQWCPKYFINLIIYSSFQLINIMLNVDSGTSHNTCYKRRIVKREYVSHSYASAAACIQWGPSACHTWLSPYDDSRNLIFEFRSFHKKAMWILNKLNEISYIQSRESSTQSLGQTFTAKSQPDITNPSLKVKETQEINISSNPPFILVYDETAMAIWNTLDSTLSPSPMWHASCLVIIKALLQGVVWHLLWLDERWSLLIKIESLSWLVKSTLSSLV